MYTLTLWNRNSTNFDANAFTRANGTSKIEITSHDAALWWMKQAINSPSVDRAFLEGPTGSLSWIRCDEEGPCECNGCDECDGHCNYDQDVDNSLGK